jgi:hypothetical protein
LEESVRRKEESVHAARMSTRTVVTTTTMGADGRATTVVTVDGKTVAGSGAEEGVPPVSGSASRTAEEKQFLIDNYPKELEGIKVEWLSALLRATVRKMVRVTRTPASAPSLPPSLSLSLPPPL